jgi:hypothetical protein
MFRTVKKGVQLESILNTRIPIVPLQEVKQMYFNGISTVLPLVNGDADILEFSAKAGAYNFTITLSWNTSAQAMFDNLDDILRRTRLQINLQNVYNEGLDEDGRYVVKHGEVYNPVDLEEFLDWHGETLSLIEKFQTGVINLVWNAFQNQPMNAPSEKRVSAWIKSGNALINRMEDDMFASERSADVGAQYESLLMFMDVLNITPTATVLDVLYANSDIIPDFSVFIEYNHDVYRNILSTIINRDFYFNLLWWRMAISDNLTNTRRTVALRANSAYFIGNNDYCVYSATSSVNKAGNIPKDGLNSTALIIETRE